MNDAQRGPPFPDVPFPRPREARQVPVGKAVLLRPDQQIVGKGFSLEPEDLLLQVDQFLHLLQEPPFDPGSLIELLHGNPLAKGLIEDELPLARRPAEKLQEFLRRFLMEILRETETVPVDFQGADGLLEGLLVGLPDAHDLSHGTHLRAEDVLGTRELLESPAGEFHDHVIPGGPVLFKGAFFPVGNLVEGQAGGKHGGNHGDGEARRLRRQGRRPGGAGIDLDDHHPPRVGVVGELDVRSSDHLNGFHDVIGVLLQPLLEFFGNREHGGGAVGIPRVDAHGIHVFDETHGDHLVFRVPDDLEFQFLPSENGLLDEDLADHARRDPPARDHLKLFPVVDEPPARPPERVGRPDHHGIPQFLGDALRLFDGVGGTAPGHFDTQAVHRFLEGDPVFPPLDGVDVHADHFHVEGVENAFPVKFRREVQPRLSPQVGENGIGALLFDDFLQGFDVQGLDVRHIGHFRVRHDRRGVGVHEDHVVTELLQGLAGLGSRIIELAGLSDDDGAGSDDQDFLDVSPWGHFGILYRVECISDFPAMWAVGV